MNTVLRATDSAHFLGLVPSLAGFTPRQSIVLLPFEHSRAHGAMRVDLPHDDVNLAEFVDAAIGLVSRVTGTDAIGVVVYTDEHPQHTPDGIVLPASILVDDLLDVAVDLGLRIVDALCVTPEGWSSYLADDPSMASLDEIPEPPPIPGIADVSGDQDAGAELPRVGFIEHEQVGRALIDLTAVLEHDQHDHEQRTNPQAIAATALLDDLSLFFESVLEAPENISPYAAAALLWCLDHPRFRDAAMLQWATDLSTGIRALEAQLAHADDGRPVRDDLGEIFLGRGTAPDPHRLKLALVLARNLAARAPRASRPAPLTVAAWLSWALGRSTHAAYYLDEVTKIDPAYSLARLIDVMISAAILPEWTFRRGEDRGASS